MSAFQSINPKRKLRWYQFSLRSLLVFVTIFAIACSWFAVKMEQARKQKEAAVALRKKGASILYDYQLEVSKEVVFQSLQGEMQEPISPRPGLMRTVLGDDIFVNVVVVDFSGSTPWAQVRIGNPASKVTDADLESLRYLKRLQTLDLDGTSVTDVGLESVEALYQLQHLSLRNTRITDAGLKKLNGMKGLVRIDLSGTKVTNTGLQHLKGLERLKALYLEDTQITDAGLEHLKGLKRLEKLYVGHTSVSEAGVCELHKSLPEVQVYVLLRENYSQ